MNKKKYTLKKAAYGLQEVTVPPAGSYADVLGQSSSLASTGAQMAGPWGALAGGVLGATMGLVNKKKQDKANTEALSQNAYAKTQQKYTGTDVTQYQPGQIYKKGTCAVKSYKMKKNG